MTQIVTTDRVILSQAEWNHPDNRLEQREYSVERPAGLKLIAGAMQTRQKQRCNEDALPTPVLYTVAPAGDVYRSVYTSGRI
ncbi:MAG: hypothetical protein HKO84_09760, partial [Pseudomonadales bacterium]|nr:hypothetical protein [Pseudomonadales bacterium]